MSTMPLSFDTSIAAPGTEPTTMVELDPAERMLIWSFRHWVSGKAGRRLVLREFTRQLGARDAPATMQALDDVMNILRAGARRTIQHHLPCCPALCADEVCVLILVASVQHGHERLAASAAGWLVQDRHVRVFVDAAGELAAAFEGRGFRFTHRVGAETPPSRDPMPLAVHATMH